MNSVRTTTAVTALLVLLSLSPPAAGSGAAAGSAAQQLADVKTANCTFSAMATAAWTAEGPKPEVRPAKLTIGFEEINADDGSARALGAYGALEVIVRLAGTTLHFLQSSRDGPIYLTTIFPKETRPGRLLAAHTRHEFTAVSMPGFTSRPEQYYGECEVGR